VGLARLARNKVRKAAKIASLRDPLLTTGSESRFPLEFAWAACGGVTG
jgi:hypothetical protein